MHQQTATTRQIGQDVARAVSSASETAAGAAEATDSASRVSDAADELLALVSQFTT